MKKLDLKIVFSIAAAIILVFVCVHYWPSLSDFLGKLVSAAKPIIFGFAVAYPTNILMSFYERHFFPKSQKNGVIKLRKPVCLIGAIISILGVVALVAVLVTPQFIACITKLFEEIPPAIEFVSKKLRENEFISNEVMSAINEFDWKTKLADMAETITAGVGNAVGVAFSAITSVFSTIANIVICIIFSLYVLLEKEKLLNQLRKIGKHYLPHKIYTKSLHVCSVMNESFRRFIVGQCLEAVILGTLCTIGMFILRIPYAPMIGALMGFTALIPVFGGLIGAGVGAFLILMDSPIKALIFIVFVIILQQFEGNVIYPKVVGSSTGLPGLWVLAAVTIGGGVSGILGMLVAVPVAATIYKLVRDDMTIEKKHRWDFLAVPEKFNSGENED